MEILVTGGAGFIGSNFIRFWLKTHPQDRIVNLDKLTYAGNLANLKEVEGRTNYRFIKGDICDGRLVRQVMEGVDWVIHFAAESHVDRSLAEPSVFLKTNILGTQMLLEAALQAKVKRFHHVSTDEVFGSLPLDSEKKFSEQTCYRPRSPYAASKAGADHLVMAYWHSFGLPVTISNCSNNYGPYQHPEKFIPRAITNVLEGRKIPIYGDGRHVRDWLYVEDHCRAIELILLKGQPGEVYCVGGLTRDINNLEVAKTLLRLMGKNPQDWLEFVPDRPGHDLRYAVDWSKIKHKLGWRPKHDFKTWLKRTIEWYQKNEWWWKPLKKEAERFYQKLAKRKGGGKGCH